MVFSSLTIGFHPISEYLFSDVDDNDNNINDDNVVNVYSKSDM